VIKKNHKTIAVLAAAIFAGLSVLAEIEEWTLSSGTSFEAEFIMDMTGYAIFRNAEGNEVKIDLDQLSPEARKKIDLKDPPKLEFDLVKDQNRKSFSGGVGGRGSGARPAEDRVHYGARVFTRSNGVYDYPLDLEVIVIGQERLGQKYIVLDKFEVKFRLNKENNKKFEYKNNRTVVLRNYVSRDEPRGEDYSGFVAIVKDMRGEVIATFSSPKFLLAHIDNLRQRGIGNYINKDGIRTFPTRPKVYF
jgi:hypothetical protein